MTSQSFIITKRKAERRLSSTIQHKLRVVMKCYTIINFVINTEEKTFTFNRTNRVNMIVIKDKKEHTGFYDLNEIEDAEEDFEYSLLVGVN